MKPVILCVDDEKYVLDSVVTQLRNHFGTDFSYEMVENAEEGWEVIHDLKEQGVPISVIISDWLMPLEKGDRFLIEVSKVLPGTALIMLSGHAEEDAIDRAYTYANLHTFIRKPWDKDHLIKEVERALKGEEAAE